MNTALQSWVDAETMPESERVKKVLDDARRSCEVTRVRAMASQMRLRAAKGKGD
jgi:hypothetical protein